MLVQITIQACDEDLRLRRSLCGKAPPFRCGGYPQTSSAPPEGIAFRRRG
jgi:hypothetical protein